MPSNQSETTLVPETSHGTKKDTIREQQAAAAAGMKWGITPSSSSSSRPYDKDGNPTADHPVHKVPLAKQEKWRKKGINPALRAEMDESGKGEGGFWRKVAQTSMGGGYIK